VDYNSLPIQTKYFFYTYCKLNIYVKFAPTFGPTSDDNRVCCSDFQIFKTTIMADLVKFVQDEFVTKKDFPNFGAGDTITVYYEIKEGEKTRTQFFKGVVIQRKGSGLTETFTIRKMSGAVGVERIFPVNMPALQKIELNQRGKVRRARIYYFRELTGKKAKIKERRR
jgi:large subunit ribosomal protein L19